jgi:heat shock protein HslJ
VRAAGVITALLVGLAGGPLSANGGGDLWGSSWQVTDIGGHEITLADGVTLAFADGGITGRAGCNRYFGPVTLRAESFESGAIGATRMACPGRGDELERRFLEALGQVTGWRISDDGALELIAGGVPLIRAVAP